MAPRDWLFELPPYLQAGLNMTKEHTHSEGEQQLAENLTINEGAPILKVFA